MANARFMKLASPMYSYIMRRSSAGRSSTDVCLEGGGGGGGGGGAPAAADMFVETVRAEVPDRCNRVAV